MRQMVGFVAAGLLALAGGTPAAGQETEGYDFGGVFDDTYAGEIDRTVIPRRPD